MFVIGTLAKIALSPRGRRLAAEVVKAAKDPKTREQIEAARKRLAERRRQEGR